MEKKFVINPFQRKKIFFFVLFLILGVGISVAIYLSFFQKPVWSQNWKEALEKASQENKPILLAVVKQSCNDPNQKVCPYSPKIQPFLGSFELVEILHGSPEYVELSYDDRFLPDIENPPVFFLLNPDGEIRGVVSGFPDTKTLERWTILR